MGSGKQDVSRKDEEKQEAAPVRQPSIKIAHVLWQVTAFDEHVSILEHLDLVCNLIQDAISISGCLSQTFLRFVESEVVFVPW